MFIDNVHPSLAHYMIMNCLQTYKDIKEKGIILEQGLIKIYKENNQGKTQPNKKSRYWNKNKHIVMYSTTNKGMLI